MESSLEGKTETINVFELPKSEKLIFEIELLIENLKKQAFDLKSEEEQRIFIQNKQLHFILILEADKNHIPANEGLTFLENHFYKYLDTKQKVSHLSRFKLYDFYKDEITQLVSQLSDLFSTNFLPIIYPLVQVYGHKDGTLDRFAYQKRLIQELVKTMATGSLSKNNILSFLIANNYNHFPFIAFLANEIVHETNKVDYVEEQTEILLTYQKYYQEIMVSKSLYFDPDHISVKDHMVKWLGLGIKSNLRKLEPEQRIQTRLEFNNQSKLQTSLSVAQLSCLLKLMIEEKLITNEIEKDVYKFVSTNFESAKSKNISFQSLYNKSFEVEKLTKDSLKTILKDLVNKLS